MKTLTFSEFKDTSEFHRNIEVIKLSKKNDKLILNFKNNEGGAIYLGHILLNVIFKSSASFLFVVDELIGSTATYVWMHCYLRRSENITLVTDRPFSIVYHKPRDSGENGGAVFCDENSTSTLRDKTERFDKIFSSIKEDPHFIPYRVTSLGIKDYQWEDAERDYNNNEDIYIRLESWKKYMKS